jgi:4-hydroxy-tetrahydrodipicolinate synthase
MTDHAAFDQLRAALRAPVVVAITPLAADGSPDLAVQSALVTRLIDGGISVVTPNGNTSEFYALTQAEARDGLEVTAKAAATRAHLLAGVGHDIATAIEAARHAQAHGAKMIMIHQPVHPYIATQGWIDYHAQIAAAVPDLGIVLYIRTDRITGQHIAALADRVPGVIGIKYGVPDPVRFAKVSRDAGLDRFTWLAGAAELTAPMFWTAGARGFTSGLANVNPGIALNMFKSLAAGDQDAAMREWERAREFEQLRANDSSADNVAVVKEALAQLGLCRPDVRPPSRKLPEEIKIKIAGILSSWGLV